jgi:Protein of unknown function (DUF3631)/Domain of unknown function (DUF3854)
MTALEQLLLQHAALLTASAISPAVAQARGYRSLEQKARLTELGFSSTQARVPALLIPIWNVHGEIATYQTRADEPRIVDGKPVKYETPRGSRMSLDVPPSCREQLRDPRVPLFVTEGVRKADAAASVGLCCVAVIGVWNWRGTNEFGGTTALADWESIALNGRPTYIVFDSDVMTKPSVNAALVRLKAFLASRHADIRLIYLLSGPGGAKVGLDDYVAAGHTVHELLGLATTELRSSPPATRPAEPAATPTLALNQTLDATVAHLTRFVHFARAEHADAVALWTAHTHAGLERLGQSPILALTSAVKQSGKTRVLDVIEFLVRAPWRITRPSESVLFRKIDADHPTVLLDEIDAIFGDKTGNTEGIRSLFNSGNRRGTKVPRNVAQGKTFALVEFDVFCPKATAGIGGLPDTILDRAIVIPMQRRMRGEPLEKLRERTARALGTPLRDALAYHIGRLEDLTVADAALPLELDDRAQDGWEPLIAIADAAGGDWPARARRAAVAIFGSRSAADDNLGLRLLADCHEVFEGTTEDFLPTAELRTALITLDQSAWADIRGREVTPHFLGKLLRAFGIESKRHRPSGIGNPVHGYFRTHFRDAWDRYSAAPSESGTSGTSGTSIGAEPSSTSVRVPDVPDVPDPATMTPDDYREVAAAAFRIFGGEDDWLLGLA